jgi:hypothetical protein
MGCGRRRGLHQPQRAITSTTTAARGLCGESQARLFALPAVAQRHQRRRPGRPRLARGAAGAGIAHGRQRRRVRTSRGAAAARDARRRCRWRRARLTLEGDFGTARAALAAGRRVQRREPRRGARHAARAWGHPLDAAAALGAVGAPAGPHGSVPHRARRARHGGLRAHARCAGEGARGGAKPRRGRLWCVFGCGGERDAGKRGPMGAIAERLADAVFVTDDNPRGEDPERIVAEILAGMQAPGPRDASSATVRRRSRALAAASRRRRADRGQGPRATCRSSAQAPSLQRPRCVLGSAGRAA